MTFDRHHPSVYAPFEAAEFGPKHLPDNNVLELSS